MLRFGDNLGDYYSSFSIIIGQETCCSTYPLRIPSICLDNISLGTPLVAEDLAAAGHLQ